jgi:hypothetical protein
MKNSKSFGTIARNYLLGAVALVAFTAAGCGDDPAGPDTTTSAVPKSGSVYNYTSYKTENGQKVSGSDSTYRFAVALDASTYAGKNNVVTFTDGSDTTRVAYEANGDLALYAVDDEGQGRWINYPFGSKTPFALPVETFYAELPNGVDTITMAITAKHVGTADVMVGSEKLATRKVDFEFAMNHRWNGQTGGNSFKTTFYYAPKIGMFARVDENNTNTEFDGTVTRDGEVRTLVNYTLK